MTEKSPNGSWLAGRKHVTYNVQMKSLMLGTLYQPIQDFCLQLQN